MKSIVQQKANSVENKRASRIATVLKPYLSGKIIDIGSYDGYVYNFLPGTDVTGVDVEIPKKTYINVEKFNGEDLPFKDNSFDTLVCTSVLHHARDPQKLVKEFKRVAGRILIMEDRYDSFLDKTAVLYAHWFLKIFYKMDFTMNSFHNHQGWLDIFSANGLKVLEVIPVKPTVDIMFVSHRLYILERENA